MDYARPLLSVVCVALVGSAPSRPVVMPGPTDTERARFAACVGARRVTCVVDGDTIWYRGEKIRVADVNAPELSYPACASEAQRATAATVRLTALLNAGSFSLTPWPGRRVDRYGRSLYVLTRDGRSLGLVLVAEGLAERWKGYRGSWC